MVRYLEKMLLMSIHEILNKEPDHAGLESYLRESLLLFVFLFYLYLYFCS